MKKKILFIRPYHNLETKYLHYFSKKLIKEIKKIGYHVPIDLEGEDATRDNVEKTLNKGKPRLVILNGHGTKDQICGHNDEVVVDEDNINLLDSMIVYTVSCDSLEGLGMIAIEKGGTECFIGYESEFMIVVDPTATTTMDRDKNCKPFRKVYVMLVISLVSGLSVSESIEKTKELMRRLIREYSVYGIRDKYGDAPLIRWALFWDLHFLNAYGNLDATF